MSTPFFSIIVPVYKVEKYLLRFLESIVDQSFTDYEVILIDDGSPDSSGILCDEFCKSHVLFRTIHQSNQGVSSARNRGIAEATGEWILFFDSDDLVHSDALACIHNVIVNRPNVDVVIYAIEEILLNGEKRDRLLPIAAPSYYEVEEIRTKVLPYFLHSSSFLNSPYSKAFKRIIIKTHDLKFRNRVRGEDWLFCLEYFRHITSAVTIPNVLYSYLRREDSAMGKYCPEQFQLWKENWQFKFDLINDYHLTADLESMRREMLVKLYYYIQQVKSNEEQNIRKQKLKSILNSDMSKEWISASPTNLRETLLKLLLKKDQIMYALF